MAQRNMFSIKTTGVWSNQELTTFFRLYRDGPIITSNRRVVHHTRFTAIEDFILETRKNYSVVSGYDEIGILNDDDNDDRVVLMRTWLIDILPSCVYRYQSVEFGRSSFYRCCFSYCLTRLSSQYAMIRHYREHHFEDMPIGIFGKHEHNVCTACGVEFKQKLNLIEHFSSLSHVQRMSIFGYDTSRCHLKVLQNSRRYVDNIRNYSSSTRLGVEENLYFSRRVSIPPPVQIWTIDEEEEEVEESDLDELAITTGLRSQSISQSQRPCTSRQAMKNDNDDEELSQRTQSQLSISKTDEYESSAYECLKDNDDYLLISDRQQPEERSDYVEKKVLIREHFNETHVVESSAHCSRKSTWRDEDDNDEEEKSLPKSKKRRTVGRCSRDEVEEYDPLDDICRMCDTPVRWQNDPEYNNPCNMGRYWYKCENCTWFQSNDVH